ncbi:PLP-dependent aminotransferase family protein [Tessaracoccus palaemonis]|uniref:PLP-dependent aminotransferase family protein n=1 Tax=Tessaracoccus palaemonis TaxID=2829499 RepID=A0ABX8SG16_9ACTN|nr:PLP-dependent aminotransferase family protein [Tessaracoccus palaemonis]QXT62261.1 PLP-dependent aminotransferase family protein [Tessaracoccus palaemonis]
MLSERIERLRPSPIRRILAVADRPGMVSFAGGLPATETLPSWSASVEPSVLQYGPSQGDPELREAVSAQLTALGLDAPADRVMILSGSQQGIDLAAKLLIDAGTPTAVESPTYLAALQVFRLYGARLVGLDQVGHGGARLAYAIPTFANPTGHCATPAERDALAAACLASGTVLFEDDPYRDLAYDPLPATPIAARIRGGSWIYQGSFSKTFAPGLRLGFLAASEDLFTPLVMLKESVDLHSSRLSQRIVLDAIESPGWPARLTGLVDFYRGRRDQFAAALDRHFAGLAEWETPPGGLFFWLRLPSPIDTRTLLDESLRRGVAFMPGEEFYPGEPEVGHLRLNFSHAAPADVDRGLATLADLLREQAA